MIKLKQKNAPATKALPTSVKRSGDQGSTRVNDILHKFPFSLPYSGAVDKDNGVTFLQGKDVPLWSARANSSTTALSFVVYEINSKNTVDPEYNDTKTYGLSVRCAIFCSTGLRPKPPLFLKAIKADFTLGG